MAISLTIACGIAIAGYLVFVVAAAIVTGEALQSAGFVVIELGTLLVLVMVVGSVTSFGLMAATFFMRGLMKRHGAFYR